MSNRNARVTYDVAFANYLRTGDAQRIRQLANGDESTGYPVPSTFMIKISLKLLGIPYGRNAAHKVVFDCPACGQRHWVTSQRAADHLALAPFVPA